MPGKGRPIACLVISAVGWLAYLCGCFFVRNAPLENKFSYIINLGVFFHVLIVASVIQLVSLVFVVVCLVQRNRFKEICVAAIFSVGCFVFVASMSYLHGWFL